MKGFKGGTSSSRVPRSRAKQDAKLLRTHLHSHAWGWTSKGQTGLGMIINWVYHFTPAKQSNHDCNYYRCDNNQGLGLELLEEWIWTWNLYWKTRILIKSTCPDFPIPCIFIASIFVKEDINNRKDTLILSVSNSDIIRFLIIYINCFHQDKNNIHSMSLLFG